MSERGHETPALLALRYHSLGDVVLATGVLRELARETGVLVEVGTDARYRCLLEGLPWIRAIHDRKELEAIAQGRGGGPLTASRRLLLARVIDLQGTPGSRRTARQLASTIDRSEPGATRVVRSLARYGLARRWRVAYGDRWPRLPVPHAVERYAETCALPIAQPGDARWHPEMTVLVSERTTALQAVPTLRPWVEEAASGRVRSGSGPLAAVIVGASRRTKAYPTERCRKVAELLMAVGWGVAWIDDPRGEASAPAGAITVRVPLGPLKAILAGADLVISSDSGPMHMAAALGVPVVAIFASSIQGFGFTPMGPWTRVVEAEDVACRPCGVHGRDRCWLGHWRCQDIAPERVVRAATELYNASRTSFGGPAIPVRAAPAEESR